MANTGESVDHDYPYYKNIKEPSAIGMSSKGTLAVLGKDIDGLTQYVSLLVSGNSKASVTGKPLGNKYFLKAGGKCLDKKTSQEVDRYIYINNVPTGNIPFVSSGTGVNFSEFKGLIPGTMSNLNAINPGAIFQAFFTGSKPDCQEITMETIDIYNNRSTETNFVTLVDIENMDPCIFPSKKNPVTNQKCREGFSNDISLDNLYTDVSSSENIFSSGDIMYNLYLGTVGILTLYSLYRLMIKNKLLPSV